LSVGLREMPGDAAIEDRLRDYEQRFVDEAIAEAGVIVADGRHDDAIALLNGVLRDVPNNAKITGEIGRIEDLRPVSLADVVVVDFRNYSHSTDIFTDSFGNHHHESFRFRADNNPYRNYYREFSNSGRAAYAVFNLNREFTTFSADIVAPEGLNSNAELLIEITFDENNIPVTYVSGFNVRAGSRPIQADVAGVTTMTIIVRARHGDSMWRQHDVRLVNAELTR